MKKNDTLFVIYRFFESNILEENKPFYKIQYAFDEHELISLEVNSFYTKEDLISGMNEYLENHSYSRTVLLSTDDYNIGMESYIEPSEMKNLFEKYGTIVQNESKSPKSLFDRLF